MCIRDSGYTLYKRAKEIISLLDVTFIDVKNLSSSVKGSLKIGASLTIGEYILPKFLAIFSKKYPDVDIEVIIENTALISSELKKFKLDIGLSLIHILCIIKIFLVFFIFSISHYKIGC